MLLYDLIEYSDNYSKTLGTLWQYYRDEPFINNNGDIIDIPDDPDTTSFNYQQKITDQAGNNSRKDVQIMVPLKYLSNFWRTLEMPLINCEINIFLTWSEKYIIVTGDYGDNVNNKPQFKIQNIYAIFPSDRRNKRLQCYY